MHITRVLSIVTDLCVKFEGVRLNAYLCPAGIPTIGIGSTFYQSGKRVTLKDDPITRPQAFGLFQYTLNEIYIPSTLKYCPSLVNESDERIAAITDFVYNLGIGRLQASTLRRKINNRQWSDVPHELQKWVFATGKKLPGLVRRRVAEADLISLN